MDSIQSVTLNNIEIQENGIIRNSSGYLIGRLSDDIDYNGEHIKGNSIASLPNTSSEVEDYFHYNRVCLFCGHTWWGLHCPHDGYQNPCPNCGEKPTPLKGNCKCEFVMPVNDAENLIHQSEIKGRIDELEKTLLNVSCFNPEVVKNRIEYLNQMKGKEC